MRSPAAGADMRLTYDDFMLFPDDGKRHEIIDGEHYVTPSPNVRHQVLVRRLSCDLENYFRSQPQAGQVFSAPLDVLLSPFDIVEPDLFVVTGDQAGILTEKNVQGPPALVIEVLSKSTRKRDAQTKRRLFERSGVREYLARRPGARRRAGVPADARGEAGPRGGTDCRRRRRVDHAAAAWLPARSARAVPQTHLVRRCK